MDKRLACRVGGAGLAAGLAAAAVVYVLANAPAAAVAGLAVASCGIAAYRAGRNDGPFPAKTRTLMFNVADELAQYRAFTRLLREQSDRISTMTAEAAEWIVTGLRDMDHAIERASALLNTNEPDFVALRQEVQAIGLPVVSMLGKLQFQDVTQQQLAFLSRLSLMVDEHMIDLAHRLGDRRAMDRVGHFKEMFAKALDDCVMSSQRNDHHTALGLDLQENTGPKIELF